MMAGDQTKQMIMNKKLWKSQVSLPGTGREKETPGGGKTAQNGTKLFLPF